MSGVARSESKAIDGRVGFPNPVVVVQDTIAVALLLLLLPRLVEWDFLLVGAHRVVVPN